MAEGDLDDLSSLKELRELVEFLKASGVTQFDVERPELKLRLKFAGPETVAGSPGISGVDLASLARLMSAGVGTSMGMTSGAGEAEHALSSASMAPAATEISAAVVDENAGLHMVRSPLVGTFYDAPSPGSEVYVKVGDRIDAGKVLCIVEAMKIMNEIESDAAGEVVKVLVKPGQPVEYGQQLFAIRA